MSRVIDLTGQKFGRLTVIERTCNGKNGIAKWTCECVCGNIVKVSGADLRNGHTSSCGCLMRERAAAAHTIHGHSDERLFTVWGNMKKRCNNPNDKEYPNYGGRGIKICEEWKSYANFREWAYANGYDENAKRGECTIDRIDNNKGYNPENCRWVTNKVQQNNTRKNRMITYNGKTQTLSQWSEELGINYAKLAYRINRSHWTIEKALSTP